MPIHENTSEGRASKTAVQLNELNDFLGANPLLWKIWVTDDDMEALEIIRDFFVEADKPGLNMLAVEVLNRIINQTKRGLNNGN